MQVFQMIEAPESFLLVVVRVVDVLPLQVYNYIFGPFNDTPHAKQSLNFHFLNINEHKIKVDVFRNHVVHKINPDNLSYVRTVFQVRRIVSEVVDLCCSSVLGRYYHLLLSLHITRSYFV